MLRQNVAGRKEFPELVMQLLGGQSAVLSGKALSHMEAFLSIFTVAEHSQLCLLLAPLTIYGNITVA